MKEAKFNYNQKDKARQVGQRVYLALRQAGVPHDMALAVVINTVFDMAQKRLRDT